MKGNFLQEMLLIQEPSVFKLYEEMMMISRYFVAPVFTIALILEYFGEMDFSGVIKKLLIVTVFMSAFYEFHRTAVEISLESASHTLKEVSPRNLFAKNWYEQKVKTKKPTGWDIISKTFVAGNTNDLLATALFLASKVFILCLKLIYSTVYHLNYVFSGITAILYFLGWTKDALKGTIQTSIWCMLQPFVLVAILALVGNSFDDAALKGETVGSGIDSIIWLFGVTLLILVTPMMTYWIVRGEGMQAAGSKLSQMIASTGMKGASIAKSVAGNRYPNGWKMLPWEKNLNSRGQRDGSQKFQNGGRDNEKKKERNNKDHSSGRNEQLKNNSSSEKNQEIKPSPQTNNKGVERDKSLLRGHNTQDKNGHSKQSNTKVSGDSLPRKPINNSSLQKTNHPKSERRNMQDESKTSGEKNNRDPVPKFRRPSGQDMMNFSGEKRKQKQEMYQEHLRKKFNGRF